MIISLAFGMTWANGFKRFYKEGFVAHNHHFNYYQTLTGPGHASELDQPPVHGIIGNEWYDRTMQHEVYYVHDEDVKAWAQQSKAENLLNT